MLIKEYRVTLPLSVEEYQVAQLYTVADMSRTETGGGEGVEIIKNEPFEDKPLLGDKYKKGQYTYKIYHLSSKVPAYIRVLAPKGALELHEEAWNAYPYCRTLITNPSYMKDNFMLLIETMHINDRGIIPNAHELTPEKLQIREVIYIDIANDPVQASDYKADQDPGTFHSKKTGRGPLRGDWKSTVTPVMTCYKLVTVLFKWFGLQTRVEQFLQRSSRRLYFVFHRRLFCLIDEWHGMSMKDIRLLEEKTTNELKKKRHSGSVQGMIRPASKF